MAVVKKMTEGSTERELFALKEVSIAGVESALDGTGLTVTDLLITGNDWQPVDTTGKFGWSTRASGIAYFDPASSDMKAEKSPYKVRFNLTDGSGKIRFYPKSGTAEIEVVAPRG